MKLLEPFRRSERAGSMSFGEWLGVVSNQYAFNGNSYTLPVQTTMTGQKAEPIGGSYEGYVNGGLMGNSVVFSLASIRMRVFAEARMQWQCLESGAPGDLFSTPDLSLFEHPWPGGTTGDLLSRMELIEQFAGNCYVLKANDELVILRPDWVEILLTDRYLPTGEQVGYRKVGYAYYEGGKQQAKTPTVLLPDEVAHFAPQPDPLATYRGMSWLTPVIREIQADGAATSHKLAFFENAATPNLAVSLAKEVTPEQFEAFVEKMDASHQGTANAYKTLYTAGGADVTVIGADMRQLDFKVTQGAGETRLASAAGVPPTVAGLSEGMQGSSLNAGNFGQARRQFADMTLSNLWRNAAGSLEVLLKPPPNTRLWYDTRDVPFLREDQKDNADIQNTKAAAIRQLVDAGYKPQSVVTAIESDDFKLLEHSDLFSVQLQAAGSLDGSPGATAQTEREETARGLAEMIQKIYLGVGKVITQEEARSILNRAGADLVAGAEVAPLPVVVGDRSRGEMDPIVMLPPNIQIDNHVAERDAPVVNVQPPNVTVENHVPVPSVQVDNHVDPTPVTVGAPTVNVPVTVQPSDVLIAGPPRTRRVVRDSGGNITKVVEE